MRVPHHSYFLDPTKSILVVSSNNGHKAHELFRGIGLKMVTGRRYPGVFIGYKMEEETCMEDKVWGW